MRRRAVLLVVVLALAGAGCGGGSDEETGGATTVVPATAETSTTAAGQPPAPKAAARWETVTTFTGDGAFETPEFSILPSAIQWRVRYTCSEGSLRITSTPAPRRPAPVVDASCPKEDAGYSILTGGIRLAVEATGEWKAVVDQQIDIPLNEPPLPGMTADNLIASGSFYKVEIRGEGTANLYRLSDGRRFLRFEAFQTGENTDLFVWLSELDQPTTSKDAVTTPHVVVGNLKSTIGTQNYEIPESVPTEKIRSIVIWCQPVQIAYAAAVLGG